MEHTQKIYEAMSLIMSEVKAIEKSKKNTTQGYKFRGIDDMYNELHDIFAKHQVFCTSEVVDFQREERTNKSGGVNFYIYNKVKYTFWAVDGSSITTMSTGEAMDSGDKASNKAMSSAHKVALIQLLMIPTEGDNDTEYTDHEIAPKKKQATVNGVTKLFSEKIETKAQENLPYPNEEEFINKISETYTIPDNVLEVIRSLYCSLSKV